MKNIALILIAVVGLTLGSCNKSYPGDTYDFTNTTAQFVEFAPKDDITANQGSSFIATVRMRTALTEDVTVKYQITGTSATITGNIVIVRNTVKTAASIMLPSGIVAPGSMVQAQLMLVSAAKGTSTLKVGANGAAGEVIAVTIMP